MRTLLLAGSAVLALSLLAVYSADEARAAPIGGARLSVAPDVFLGFGCGCPRTRRRVVVVRRRVVAPTTVVVRRTYIPRRYYVPYYRPYYRPYYGPSLYLGFGVGHGYHYRGHHRGPRRVVGRRR
jgi:hypothetical protein